jgi:hypothetical protein
MLTGGVQLHSNFLRGGPRIQSPNSTPSTQKFTNAENIEARTRQKSVKHHESQKHTCKVVYVHQTNKKSQDNHLSDIRSGEESRTKVSPMLGIFDAQRSQELVSIAVLTVPAIGGRIWICKIPCRSCSPGPSVRGAGLAGGGYQVPGSMLVCQNERVGKTLETNAGK